ncbi:hypothetical protein ACOMHN_048077 [Nucella lapillus]
MNMCDEPPSVTHGSVTASGRYQDDVVYVVCDEGFIMTSPGTVSVELTCLVTSSWTAFTGECIQYEFSTFVDGGPLITYLPRTLSQDSSMCVRGWMNGAGQFYINLRAVFDPLADALVIVFRYQFQNQTQIAWNTKINDAWGYLRHLADNPLLPGDPFNLTLHVHTQHVQLVLNGDITYNIPLERVRAEGVEVSELRWVAINKSANDTMFLTYVNLISAC